MSITDILTAIAKGFTILGVIFLIALTAILVCYLVFTAWLHIGERGEDEGNE